MHGPFFQHSALNTFARSTFWGAGIYQGGHICTPDSLIFMFSASSIFGIHELIILFTRTKIVVLLPHMYYFHPLQIFFKF